METPIRNVYQISETIYEALQVCADSEYYTFAVLEPREDDDKDRRKALKAELDEILDLVQLDLLKDISDKYKSMIKHCQQEHGFGYRVLELTQAGILMFTNVKGRKVQ